MKRSFISGLILLFALLTSFQASAITIDLMYTGPAAANDTAQPDTDAFRHWCGAVCFPTTKVTMIDSVTKNYMGTADVWAKNFQFSADGQTIAFSEFIRLNLKNGTLYIMGASGKTVGAFLDRDLVPPVSSSDPNVYLVAGGGEGTLVGGTGVYDSALGYYKDRVFVDINKATFAILYYDFLIFNINITSTSAN